MVPERGRGKLRSPYPAHVTSGLGEAGKLLKPFLSLLLPPSVSLPLVSALPSEPSFLSGYMPGNRLGIPPGECWGARGGVWGRSFTLGKGVFMINSVSPRPGSGYETSKDRQVKAVCTSASGLPCLCLRATPPCPSLIPFLLQDITMEIAWLPSQVS